VLDKRLKIPITEQQGIIAFNAPRRNQGVDGFPDRHTPRTQRPEIARRLNGNLRPAQCHHVQRRQQFSGLIDRTYAKETFLV
jgi:hypothetical protein